MDPKTVVIDGSYGEGGGQILRTSVSLSAMTGRSVHIENIRAGRPRPGLAAQHLTAVRAVAALCGAKVEGDELGSLSLRFHPGMPPMPCDYSFDVGAARSGGSAGSVSLILQAVIPPLLMATGNSRITVFGGTHIMKAPFHDYLDAVWGAALARMGGKVELTMPRSGWFPVGKGRVEARVCGGRPLKALTLTERGPLRRVWGRALVANLREDIAVRMAVHARRQLEPEVGAVAIEPGRLSAACSGAGIILVADYEHGRAGFTALGRRGRPAEDVAEEAVAALLDHHQSGAAVDKHLGDQLLVPAAIAEGRSIFSMARITSHLATNAGIIERFGLARVRIAEPPDRLPTVTVYGAGLSPPEFDNPLRPQ